MPAGRPRGGNGGFRGHPAPMSERQQLALLLQLTSQEKDSGGSSSLGSISSQSTSSEQHRASRSRCRNERGETHLHVAAIRGDEVQVRRLLAKGADPNAKDFAGWTPLHEACNHGWLGTARILVEAGASVNALGLDDDTPLHDAAVNGHQELVKLLVDHGADSTLKNKRGKTPVDVASGGLDPSSFVPEKSDTENNHEESTTSSLAGSVESSSDGKDDIAIQRSLDTSGAASPDKQHRQTGSSDAATTTTSPVAEDSGDPCEMRRTLSQNKVDRSATGGSPRVLLRLNQVRSTRDDRRAATTSRHGVNSQTQNMDSYKTVAASSGNSTTTASHNTGNTSGDIGDVYEFKSSKEATPVRGVSTSPNPPNKDKEPAKTTGGNGNNASRTSNTPTASGAITPARVNETPVNSSPFAKRAWENESTDEQDEENRRKRRKDFETTKENTKAVTTGRQGIGRSNATSEKTTKPGKQGTNTVVGKNNQAAVTPNADRKSPNSSAASGSSPKPSTTAGSTNSKTATPAPPDSDGEDDRSKSSDSNSAPKVPPLKIVIPQSTASEQEQGNRNSKNTSNRNHPLPYVVPSSNSNDSTDKDQNQSGSGTTSPTEGAPNKPEDKKDFSGALHAEERSIHYQRVLRSSHRSGNGANSFATSKDASASSSGNGNYFNSSPLPATTTSTTDRSNDSSPQQRHHSPVPETTSSEPSKTASTEPTAAPHNTAKTVTNTEKPEKNTDANPTVQKDAESSDTASSTQSTTNTSQPTAPVELHPRKRKMKPGKEAQQAAATAAASEAADSANTGPEVHPHDQPITNCYELFLNIRQQIERRRKGLFPVQPKPPQGFKDYLMNRCTYVLAGIENKEPNVNPPVSLPSAMKDLYVEQEKERYRLRMQHVVEKEKLVLSVEQEILRVHGRAARALANQSLPFSVCTILKDEEVYNVITPEQEEKDRNARSRYNGRLFLSWLQDVDDKWEKIKEAMLMRHHNEAESLHAVQKMDWEWKMKEVGLCEFKARAQIEDLHVPMVHVSDDFDLLPA